MEAKVILAKIQRYADACYMVTQGHRKAIEALTTVEDVEGYDNEGEYMGTLVWIKPIRVMTVMIILGVLTIKDK